MAFLAMYTGSPYDDSLKPRASLETALEREIEDAMRKLKKLQDDTYVYCYAHWGGFMFEPNDAIAIQDDDGWHHIMQFLKPSKQLNTKALKKGEIYFVWISKSNYDVVKVFEEVK